MSEVVLRGAGTVHTGVPDQAPYEGKDILVFASGTVMIREDDIHICLPPFAWVEVNIPNAQMEYSAMSVSKNEPVKCTHCGDDPSLLPLGRCGCCGRKA